MIEIEKPAGSIWSDDQWKAISLHGDHILVAAAAGSGKTAVLVERIIRKIMNEEQGFSVDRLLVATFTKAAAAEMRERIRDALDQQLEKDPENAHLRRQLSLLGRASITTLHSFCLEVIRRYYQMIPIDPGFRILNENEAELMRQEILEELFEEKYGEQSEDSDFIALVDWFSGERTDDAVYHLVQRLYDFSRSHSWPDQWLRDMAASFLLPYTASLGESQWVKSILQDARLALAGAEGLLEQARRLTLLPGGPGPYLDNLNADLDVVQSLRDALDNRPWDELFDRFQSVSFSKLKSCRKEETDPALQERVKELREAVKKTVQDLKGALFGRPADAFLAELHRAAPLMKELSELVIEFGDRYLHEKQRRNAVDFSDLEHYCLQILRHPDSVPGQPLPSDAAVEYQEQFDEVLLDEYQDTNSVQEDIVKLISRELPGNRFMVGDVKQSIYRFRLAEPSLFLDKYRRYASAEGGGIRIDLARNFRSRLEVVHAVNMVFRQLMNETVAEISYDERAELVYGASYPAAQVEGASGPSPYVPELVLIDKARSGDASEDEPLDSENGGMIQESEAAEMETAQLEARAIAKKIRALMGDTSPKPLEVFDKETKSMRPVRYGDMVILLRSAYIWGPLIMEELRQLGIPADGEQNQGYFQATEVEIMLSLLQIIDNPRQDIPLAGVLRSPIVGLTEEDLAQVRLCGKGTFYEAVMVAAGEKADVPAEPGDPLPASDEEEVLPAYAESAAALEWAEQADAVGEEFSMAPELQRKLAGFLSSLERWRNTARQGSLGDLIWLLYRETGYLDWVGGLPGGMQRQDNLKALHDRAVQFEQTTSSRGLFRFLTFISRLRDNGSDLGGPGAAESRDNAVRIMTIHKSKGLEFPVVFLAGMSKMFNQQDLNASFLMHKELGFGPKFVDTEKRVSYPTLPNLAIRRRSQLELLAEEMRVLYVGLTRPKEKMIMIGTVKDLEKKVSSWAQVQNRPELMLPDYMLARGRSYLDWVGPALIRHPAADKLRELGGLEGETAVALENDPSDWRISILSTDDLSLAALGGWEEAEESTPERRRRLHALLRRETVSPGGEERDEAFGLSPDQISARLAWQYPYAAASRLSAKTSVTEMKKLLALQDGPTLDWVEETRARRENSLPASQQTGTFALRRPKFMEQSRMSPTERGTVYHTVMQHIPLDAGTVDVHVVEATLQRLVDLAILTSSQAEIVEPEQIASFFDSDIGKRLQAAEWESREMPFSYGLPAHQAHQALLLTERFNEGNIISMQAPDAGNRASDEVVLIQGIVDCLFRQDGKYVIVDYKTDRVLEHRGGVAALAESYRFQLELYARALEDILGEPVQEKWLYFVDAKQSVLL